ncbi:MAG: energy transducer TonB [Nitrospirae bacterium]|nr:energy transducer TonB [Nitrospirota bacterium]
MKSVFLSTGAVKIDYYGSRITKEIVVSSTLHFILVILLMFAPLLLMQKNEPTITEITIVDNLEPIPFPVIRPEPSAPAGTPPPPAVKIPKGSGQPSTGKGLVDDAPVRDIKAGFGIPTKAGLGAKEGASFSQRGSDLDAPIPRATPIREAKNANIGIPGGKGADAVPSGTVGIKGTAGKRRVIFRPSQPAVDTSVNITVELEFAILPDGAVVNVVPLRKADSRLEEIAIRWLKNWRFNSVSDEDKTEYVGTIPITFRVIR